MITALCVFGVLGVTMLGVFDQTAWAGVATTLIVTIGGIMTVSRQARQAKRRAAAAENDARQAKGHALTAQAVSSTNAETLDRLSGESGKYDALVAQHQQLATRLLDMHEADVALIDLVTEQLAQCNQSRELDQIARAEQAQLLNETRTELLSVRSLVMTLQNALASVVPDLIKPVT